MGFITGVTSWTTLTEYRLVEDVRSNVIMADVELVHVSEIDFDSVVTKTEAILKFRLKTVKQSALQDSVNFFFGTKVRVQLPAVFTKTFKVKKPKDYLISKVGSTTDVDLHTFKLSQIVGSTLELFVENLVYDSEYDITIRKILLPDEGLNL